MKFLQWLQDTPMNWLKNKYQLIVKKPKHTSIFVNGWRPATGWICVAGMGFNFIAVPIGNFGCALAGIDVVMPNLDISEMMPVLLGMLRLRSYENCRENKESRF